MIERQRIECLHYISVADERRRKDLRGYHHINEKMMNLPDFPLGEEDCGTRVEINLS